MEIPIVDFSDCSIGSNCITDERLQEIGDEVYSALANIGFVYLDNTGIPGSDIEEAFHISKIFFDLPGKVKRKYQYDEHYSGYHDMCIERTNPDRPNDYKESFQIGGMALASQDSVWPDGEVQGFSNTFSKLLKHCNALSMKLLQVLAHGMKLRDKDYLSRTHSRIGRERNYTTLRTLHYPPLPKENSLQPGQLRLGEHTDYGSFTLLFQGDVGGLEIEKPDGSYVEARPIPGTVLVNIGDLLHFWSGGRLKSTKHRIRNPMNEAGCRRCRQSIVCFVHPNYETVLEELNFNLSTTPSLKQPQFTAKDGKCITAVEWAEMRYDNAYAYNRNTNTNGK